ncbi:MAG TPA: UbiX family flavin prenyltransferase [Clostridia bacterium]|nr:UbiX family flavin prenyltransferase [Clostridia bacterium]
MTGAKKPIPTRVIIGITGASGSVYGVCAIRVLLKMGVEVHLIVSETGEKVLRYECGIGADQIGEGVKRHDVSDLFSPVASGTYPVASMAIVPCSMNTLGMLANGLAPNLLLRCADVTLKECRPLVIVPREAPLNASHLENMLRLARMGARIVPLAPAFYHRPTSLRELIAPTVARIVSMLGVTGLRAPVWTGGVQVGTQEDEDAVGQLRDVLRAHDASVPGWGSYPDPALAPGQDQRPKVSDYRDFVLDLIGAVVESLCPNDH